MARIAAATFQHETNTFAPTKAGWDAFEHGGGWPGFARGAVVAERLTGMNIPVSGFMPAAAARGHRVATLAFASATPSAHVTREAYERGARAILEELEAQGPFDAVYLDLHGAMVAEHHDDGEGELLRRARALIGPRVPIVASLDMHANVSPAMVEHSDGLVAYRTYPHVDMAETGARAAALLDAMLASGDKPAKAREAIDFLVPITAQCTSIEPGRALYASLVEHERAHDAALSLTMGFPAADFHDCGPSVIGYSRDPSRVRRAVRALADDMNAAEGAFNAEFLAPSEAVARAMAAGTPGRPVILADTQDNPGAGGNGDTIGLLEALLAHPAREAALGLLVDRDAARQAHELGVGAEAEFALGARHGSSPREPLRVRLRVEALGDGSFTCTGPVYQGSRMKLGPMAALRQGGVTVVVSSEKVQAADQDMFRHVGIEPARMRILALKSSVHFRAHFEPIASDVLVVASPGPNPADPADLAWTKLRPGIRLRPRGPRWLPPDRSPRR